MLRRVMMKPEIAYSLYHQLKSDNLSFYYSGMFNDGITEYVVDLSNESVSNIQSLAKLRKRLSFLMIECLQNVVRHDPNKEITQSDTPSLFVTRNVGEVYYITSVNLIKNDKIEQLTQHLENLNELDALALKSLYKETLTQTGYTENGGGGLGLIEMVRRSKHKIEFKFEPWNDTFSHFFFQVKLSPKDHGPKPLEQVNTSLGYSESLMHEMHQKGILIIHRGDFSKDYLVTILNVIESNLENMQQTQKTNRRIYLTMVELLQNVSRHGMSVNGAKSGIFILAKQDDKFRVIVGNIIDNAQQKGITEQIDAVNHLSKEELTTLYRKTLKESELSEEGGAGLGFIEIRKRCKCPIEYGFTPFEENCLFYSVMLTIAT